MAKKYQLIIPALAMAFLLCGAGYNLAVLKTTVEDRLIDCIKKYAPAGSQITVNVEDVNQLGPMADADDITAQTGDVINAVMTGVISGLKSGKKIEKTVKFKVEEICTVLAVSRTLQAGAMIDVKDITYLKKNIAGLNFKPFMEDNGTITGKRTARAIQAGKIISPADLEVKSDVIPGQQIRILCVNDNMKIETSGRAEEKGSIGDIIKVTNATSKKLIYAKIVSADTVEIGGAQ
jgi:flagella basal body P-ring formation protein FlgA